MPTADTLEIVTIVVLMLGFITYRQTRWQPVRLSKLLRMPVIFAVAAFATIPTSVQSLPTGWRLGVRDVALIGVELALGVVVGILMGRWTEIATHGGSVVSRVAGRGIAVWIGFIAVRVSLGIFGSTLGAPLGRMMSIAFFMVVTVKVAQAIVIRSRVAQQGLAQNQPPLTPSGQGSRVPAGV